MAALDDILTHKKLIVVCGSGGVGKTTTAATLALKGALAGRKTIVLTIDPARRLATSLGLSQIASEPKRIPVSLLEEVSGVAGAQMYAMMLDPKSTFDTLVIKHSPSKAVEKKILGNKIYQHLSNMIAGSQEYMAMEKLYEIVSENRYDLIVIDTPPTIHAIDFLEAPERMIEALSNSMIHLLLKPAMFVGKSSLKFLEKGTKLILKVFDRITGFAFLQDISEMLISFQGLLGGFTSRAAEVRKILTDDGTAFVLVTACEEKSVREAELFTQKLRGMDLPLEGIVINRVKPLYTVPKADREGLVEKLARSVGKNAAEKMQAVFENYLKEARRDQAFKQEIASMLTKDQFVAPVPLRTQDIHDLKGLYDLTSNF